MWTVQGQNGGQRNQCSYSLHLFQQSNFGIHFLGDLLDSPIVFGDALFQRFDFPQQWIEDIPQLGVQSFRDFSIHLPGAALPQPLTIRFRQPARSIHQGRACADQCRSSADNRQTFVGIEKEGQFAGSDSLLRLQRKNVQPESTPE
jgi:hypothetical protein